MPACRALLCVNTTRGESCQGYPVHPGGAAGGEGVGWAGLCKAEGETSVSADGMPD